MFDFFRIEAGATHSAVCSRRSRQRQYQGIRTIYPPLLFYTLFTLWKLYFLTAKFPAQFLPSLQFLPFIARKYPEFLPNVISSGTLGVPDENLHIISTKRQFLFFIMLKSIQFLPNTISTFYLVIEIRKDHAVKGETNWMKLFFKGRAKRAENFEILFLPS